MNIVVASDQNYVPHLETLLVSIGENNQSVDNLKIHVLDGGIEERSKSSIYNYSDRYPNMSFVFYKMHEKDVENLLGGGISKDRSLSTYARLFIPEIIREDRAIYFDVDAVVLDDLRELYSMDLDGFAIAGVRDTNPVSRHRKVGLHDTDPYINTGMIVWNLRLCRFIELTKQCVSFVGSHGGNVDAMDQGTINGVLGKQGLIKIVHPRFNVFTALLQHNGETLKKIYGFPEYYSNEEILEARQKPVFVHFTPNMTTRPWVEHCKNPYKEEYWKYRSLTEHKKRCMDKDIRSLKLRVLGFIYRKAPRVYIALVELIK